MNENNIRVIFKSVAFFSAYRRNDNYGIKVGKTTAVEFTPATSSDNDADVMEILVNGTLQRCRVSKVRFSKEEKVAPVLQSMPLQLSEGIYTRLDMVKRTANPVLTPMAAFTEQGPVGDAAVVAAPPKPKKSKKSKK